MAWLDSNNTFTQESLDREIRRGCTHLKKSDPVVAALIDRFGSYRMEVTSDYFQLLLETIINQQLSTKAALTIYGRVKETVGTRSPKPRDVLATSQADLRAAGLSRSKAQFVHNVAEAFSGRRMGPKTFAKMSDDEVIERVTEIKGIGEWSAHMFLMFGLKRLDVFPVGDVGLRNAMTKQYRMRQSGSLQRYHRIADRWRPYRTVGSLYLWKSYDGL